MHPPFLLRKSLSRRREEDVKVALATLVEHAALAVHRAGGALLDGEAALSDADALAAALRRDDGRIDIGVARASELHVRMEAFAGERL